MKRKTAFIPVSEDEVVKGKHKWILNTSASLEEAIQQGEPYHSIYSFSSIPNANEPAPFIFGDLWIVTTDHRDRRDALEAMRRIVEGILSMHRDIEPAMLHYSLDNRDSVFLRIPAEIFGGECGVPLLPLYHRQMADKLLGYIHEPNAKMATCSRVGELEPRALPGVEVRADVYDLLRPFMFLEPGINHGDSFTMEVDYKSLMNMYPTDLWAIVEERRQFPIDSVAPQITSLHRVYDAIMFTRCELLTPNIRKEAVSKCPFFKSCMARPENMDGKMVKLFFRLLAPLGRDGLKMAQEWGEKVLGSSEVSIRERFMEALQEREIVTCAEIAKIHGCDGSCGVHSPYEIDEREQAGAVVMENYRETKDGLYCLMKNRETDEICPVKVCSPIFTLGKVCNPDGSGWSREVKLEAPDKKSHTLTIPNAECMKQNPDTLLAKLCDFGLELAPGKHSATLLKRYFREASPARIKVGVRSLGWVGDCYVLPDIVIGYYDKNRNILAKLALFRLLARVRTGFHASAATAWEIPCLSS